jgi:Flp pilus assembly protein TadG
MSILRTIKRMPRFWRNERGSAAVELALYLPFALVLFAGLFQYGSGIFASLRLESATRAGAQYAMVDANNAVNIENAVLSAIGGDTADVQVTTTTYCQCPESGSQTDCATASCSGGAAPNQYVSIAARRPFTTILGLASLAPLNEVSGHAVIRVR